jgi:hypothetical protein
LVNGGFTYDPASGEEQGSIDVKWTILNTGQIPATGKQADLFVYSDYERTNETYYQSKTNQTFPTGTTILTYTLTDLPDGSSTAIYNNVNAYVTGTLVSHFNVNSQFEITPCEDYIEADYISSPYHVTGNTTLDITFDLYNNSCHNYEDDTWTLEYKYYSGTTDNTLVDTYYVTMPFIEAGESITIGSGFQEYSVPNNWGNNTTCKVVISAIRDTGGVFGLTTEYFTYWVSEPDIQVIDDGDTLLSSGSTWDSLQLNVKCKNYGSGSGSAYVTLRIVQPSGADILRTGFTETFSADETKILTMGSYGISQGGTYTCYYLIHSEGEVVDSGTEIYDAVGFMGVYFDQDTQSAGTLKYYGNGNLTINVSVRLGCNWEAESYDSNSLSVSSEISLYSGSTLLESNSGGCTADPNDSCYSYDESYVDYTINGIVISGDSGGSTDINISSCSTLISESYGFAYGSVSCEILSISITSGTGACSGVGEWVYGDDCV